MPLLFDKILGCSVSVLKSGHLMMCLTHGTWTAWFVEQIVHNLRCSHFDYFIYRAFCHIGSSLEIGLTTIQGQNRIPKSLVPSCVLGLKGGGRGVYVFVWRTCQRANESCIWIIRTGRNWTNWLNEYDVGKRIKKCRSKVQTRDPLSPCSEVGRIYILFLPPVWIEKYNMWENLPTSRKWRNVHHSVMHG